MLPQFAVHHLLQSHGVAEGGRGEGAAGGDAVSCLVSMRSHSSADMNQRLTDGLEMSYVKKKKTGRDVIDRVAFMDAWDFSLFLFFNTTVSVFVL